MNRLIALLAFALLLTGVQFPAFAQDDYDIGVGRRPGGNRVGVPSRWRGSPQGSRIRAASHLQEEVFADDVVHDGEYIEGDYIEGDYVDGGNIDGGCDSCGGGGCDSCSVAGNYCGSCNAPNGFCICFPAHGWIHAEYLTWWQSGMDLPPLVTTSPTGTARAAAGVLGQAGTGVLYGNDSILSDARSGFRLRFGWWLANFPGWGIEGEYVGLGSETESFFQQSTGDPIIARPFFNALTGAEDSELVAFPGVVSGSIAVDSSTEFEGGAVRLRKQLFGTESCGYSAIHCREVPVSTRFDLTMGYRYWQLQEQVQTREQLTLQTTNPSGTFDITDTFHTRNQFNGAEIGFLWQGRRGWWSLDALMRLGIGNVHQTVTVSGNSTIVENGATSTFNTGFLAQRSNIGVYDRDQFTMIPELGLTLGYQMTRRIRATMGYSLIYWGNVVRPGDQIDTDINPNLLAPEANPFTGPLRPQFQFAQTDYWVQGLSFGGEFRW